MKKIVFINEKGGVGKTSCCFNTAWELSKRGKKVLIIDLDGQKGNITFVSGIRVNDDMLTTYDVLQRGKKIDEVKHNLKENLDIVPASMETTNLSETAKIATFKTQLKEVENEYDYVFMDVNPTPGRSHVMTLAVADYAIIPMEPDVLSLSGTSGIAETIEQLKDEANHNLKVLGIVFNKFSPRTNLSKDVYLETSKIARKLNTKIFDSTIRRGISLSELPASHTGITDYDPGSLVAEDIIRFTNEFEKEVAANA